MDNNNRLNDDIPIAERPSRPPVRKTQAADTTRKIAVEEKGRGKRLFGNLMTSLGRIQKDSLSNSFRSQEKRRREIEEKIRHKLLADEVEVGSSGGQHCIILAADPSNESTANEPNAEVLAKRLKIEEVKRNKRLVFESSYLKTQALPSILFLPRVLTRAQEDTLDTQREQCRLLQSEQEGMMME